jgi:hypothetical protein
MRRELLREMAVAKPAHVTTFRRQVHSKGILGGTEDSGGTSAV